MPKSSPKHLLDAMGRRISYLRVSLTDQCNFRCGYCYPFGYAKGGTSEQLSLSDIFRLIRAFASLGVSKVRFTGGEPLLRPGIVELVRKTAELKGISHVGLTTNGMELQPVLQPLIEAGLNCLNISLDTLSRETFRKITGVDGFERVYSAILAAERCDAFERVKINTVVMRGVNDSEVRRFALWALHRRLDLRFIEYMPTHKSDEIRNRIDLNLAAEEAGGAGRGPAVSYRFQDYPGRISFISAVSRCFCGECNRLRLTSGGELLGCLYMRFGADLRKLLVANVNTNEIAEYIRRVVASPGFRRLPQETSVAGFNPYMRKVGG